MADETKIEPALSADEWARAFGAAVDDDGISVGDGVSAYVLDDDDLHIATEWGNAIGSITAPAKLVALANAALPDDDPRKITREVVRDIRGTAQLVRRDMGREYGPEAQWGNVPRTLAAMADRAIALADALASYLPPDDSARA